tara:strand:- start:297 stop:593 length:297 start_codon:yes stop_codon:yes gene_type:complete
MQVKQAVDFAEQFLRKVVGPGMLHRMAPEPCPEGTFIGQYDSKAQLYSVAIKPTHDSRGTPYISVHIQTADDAEKRSGDWRIYSEAGDWDLPRRPLCP